MRLIVLFWILGSLTATIGSAQTSQADHLQKISVAERFVFEVDGIRLDGLFERTVAANPVATILIVHGYGKTNVVEENWYYDLRSRFASIGINTLIWDKPGCGNSEGEFDANQSVESSAGEVVAAVRALKKTHWAGTQKIGLWGISRAGWVAPLAMQRAPDIDFWISVSGTDAHENARYLLASNLPLEGRSPEETALLVGEWQARFNTVWQGGTYQQYLQAGPNLSTDPFMTFMGWGGSVSEQEFLAYQDKFLSGEYVVDEVEELMVYVPGFEEVLSSIDRPVLALFGEKDTNVDWRKTAALYEQTIGANPSASLTIKVFPEANHNLRQSITGGIREMYQQAGDASYAEGYYDTMLSWLIAHHFGIENR